MQKQSKKRFFLYTFLLACVCSLFFFQHTLICTGIKLFLKTRLPKGEALFVDYESARWEKSTLSFHQVQLSRKATKQSAGFDVQIEDLKCLFSLTIFPFEFHTELTVMSPEVSLTLTGREEKQKKELHSLCKKTLFKKAIVVNEGKLVVNQEASATGYFSFMTCQGEEKAGKLFFSRTLETLEKPPLEASFKMQDADIHFDLHFEALSVPWAASFAPLVSLSMGEIDLSEGTLGGDMVLGLGKEGNVSHVQYDLKLDHLALSYAKYGMSLQANQIHWKEHFTSNKQMESYVSHPFFEKIWPYFVGDGDFLGVRLAFENPQTHEDQGIIELRGKLSFSPRNEPMMDFYGLFKKEDREYPMRLVGEAQIEKDKEWKFALDLALHEEGGEKMATYLSLTSKGEKSYLFESDFHRLSLDPIELIQNLVKVPFPSLDPFHFERGCLTGSLGAWIDQGQFQRLEIKQCAIEECSFFDTKRELLLTADKLEGSGEFDFSTSDFFDGTFWQLQMEKGSLRKQEELYFSELSMQLSMHDQYVKPSQIHGLLKQNETAVQIEGLYTHLNVSTQMRLTPQDLMHYFGIQRKEVEGEPFVMATEMRLKSSQRNLEAEGKLFLERENSPTDAISFTALFDLNEVMENGFMKGLKEGRFSGESISSKTFNLPFHIFETSYYTKGKAAIEGTYCPDFLSLIIDPSHLEYHSPYVEIMLGDTALKAPFCHFRYTFADETWTGQIPLSRAKLTDRSFGLVFDSFNSDVEFCGDLFTFKHIEAITEGVLFKGHATLDYQYEDYAELSIAADEVEGSTKSVQAFLRHFSPFANLNAPLEGRISSEMGGMSLKAYVGDREEMLSWNVNMELHDGRYPITSTCSFEGLATRFEWSWEDQTLRLINSDGNLRLGDDHSEKLYHLNIPVAEANFTEGKGYYDLRLETPIHEICRLVGEAKPTDVKGEIALEIDEELTRFFGTKIQFKTFHLAADGSLNCIDAETRLTSRDLYHHLDFLVHAGLIPFKASLLEEMQSPRLEGETYLKLHHNQADETFAFEAHSDHFAFGNLDLETLTVHIEKKGDQIKVDRFQAGSLSLKSQMSKDSDGWNIKTCDFHWKHCRLYTEKGLFNPEKKSLSLPLSQLNLDLPELIRFLPQFSAADSSYLQGRLTNVGSLELFFPKGWKNFELCATFAVKGEEFSKGNLSLESEEPLECHFSLDEGLTISKLHFNFFHPKSHELWAKCHLDSLKCQFSKKQYRGEGCHVVLPPEMLHHLGVMRAVPHLGADEEYLFFMEHPFKWDNQMELSCDFLLGDKTELIGNLKEGYYWIQDKAWYLNDFRYHLEEGELRLKMNTLFETHPFDMTAAIQLLPHLKTAITIQETLPEKKEKLEPLKILTDWSENEGFFIQSIEGTAAGLTFSFHHNPKSSFIDQMVLTGQLKIDMPTLSSFLPKTFRTSIQECEIGKGYELSGDCVLSKENISDSHFAGYLKGKKFELFGSEMETLMSEITIHTDQVELSGFNLSDASGIFSIDHMRFAKGDENLWEVTLPKLAVQNFRPSQMKKIGKYRGKIKPLIVREMHFDNIRGTLGEARSFTGKGTLSFTNTFKEDYNLLDIPFEILGRLGLDMGLLVPVRGHLDFVMTDGKVYLTELSDSYSEGKRSKFYLSPVQHSFIDFNGNVNINIKMKQYVLLKITEPFTLSIGGNFEKLRYSLK